MLAIVSRSDTAHELPLSGGRLTAGVVRLGDTVRRPTGPHSAFVHDLLTHLEAVGFVGAPRLLGLDEHGREILSYIAGWVPPNLDHFPDAGLVDAAQLLRALHDTTAGSSLAGDQQVVCHNDPSPCNYVFRGGRPVALIDFDHAAPGARIDDLAYMGWLWTISADDGPPIPHQARRLRLMAHTYGLGDTRGLLDAVIARQEQNLAAAQARSRSPIPAVAEYAKASVAWQREQLTWLRTHQAEFRAVVDA
jgi:hypothetical protein